MSLFAARKVYMQQKEDQFMEEPFEQNFEHNSSRLEYYFGMSRSNKDSLFDNDGLIIFKAF